MLYEYVQPNLFDLMQKVGTLQREQIIEFFNDMLPNNRIQKILNNFTIRNILTYDEKKDRYTFHSAPKVSEIIVNKRIDAFWVIANWGSTDIISIDLLEYPSQFSVIDVDDMVYDITICLTPEDGERARQKRVRYLPKNKPDIVNHIAVVYDKTVGEELQKYGFDSYAVLKTKTRSLQYFEYEE